MALSEVDVGATTLSKIGAQLADWTNNKSLVNASEANLSNSVSNMHSQLLATGLEMAITETLTFRKLVCFLISKYDYEFTAFNCDDMRGKATDLLAVTRDDATCKRVLDKFLLGISEFKEKNVDIVADGVAAIVI